MQKLKLVLPIVLLFGVSAAEAQGLGSAAPVTQAQSVPTAANDRPVKLRGEIVGQESRERYVFSDGTANILVRADPYTMDSSLTSGTPVEVVGEVDNRGGRAQVDARSITVLADASGADDVYQDYHHNTPD